MSCKCEYDNNKICEEVEDCEAHSVVCDECSFISEEGYCDNSECRHYCRFMDGLSTCCKCFKKKI